MKFLVIKTLDETQVDRISQLDETDSITQNYDCLAEDEFWILKRLVNWLYPNDNPTNYTCIPELDEDDNDLYLKLYCNGEHLVNIFLE